MNELIEKGIEKTLYEKAFKHPPFHSKHEFFGVLYEELTELTDNLYLVNECKKSLRCLLQDEHENLFNEVIQNLEVVLYESLHEAFDCLAVLKKNKL